MLFDQDGYVPSYAVMTDDRTADIAAAKPMVRTPHSTGIRSRLCGSRLVAQLTGQKVHPVTRLKDSIEYAIVEQLAVPESKNVLRRDEVILRCSADTSALFQ